MGSDFKLSESARRLGLSFSGGGGLRGRGLYIVIGVVAAIVVISLALAFLPSRALLGCPGCTRLSSQSPSASHPDGISLTLLSSGEMSVKLDSIPRLSLVEGTAGGDWKAALQALPANLTIKSPLYLIQASGPADSQLMLSVTIPNDAEPWETLDLYTWNGQAWQWVGGQLDLANEVLNAQPNPPPSNVLVVQTGPLAPAIASDVTQPPSGDSLSVVNEIILPGLTLGSSGQVQGSLAMLSTPPEGASYVMIPAVRNWIDSRQPNVGLVLEMLGDAALRSEHVRQLVAIVADTPYAGLQIDYRNVPADSRQALSSFVAELAAALHEKNKLLSIVLPPPAPTLDGTWDTAGYDWRAIGALADAVVLEPSADPLAYGPNGQAAQIVRWATGQIDRYKLQLAFGVLSEEHAGEQVMPIAYQDALKMFGTVAASGGQAAPGEAITFKLNGDVHDVSYDEDAKVYHFTFSGSGTPHTVYLVTAAALNERLSLAARYNLRGVLARDLLDTAGRGDARLLSLLQQYQEQSASSLPGTLEVVWTVRSQAGAQLPGGSSQLTDLTYVWTAPSAPGEYVVAAAIPGAASRGETSVKVVAATPTPAPSPTPAAAAAAAVANAAAAEAGECLDSAYVADVSVPDGQKFDKGVDFTKTWRVKNSGTCDWDKGVSIAYQSGEKMGGADSVSIDQVVKAGQQIDISVPMKSPEQDGNYKGVWRLKDSQGQAFGEVLTVIIVSGEPAPVNVPAGGGGAPPPPANVGGFEIGGHVSGFSRPDLMKQAGMTWIKVQVHHGAIPYDLIAMAHNNGFNILFGALGDKGRVTSPDYQAEYAQWVAQLAAAGADAIEVWNEMNIDREWPTGQIDPANYVNLLRQSYSAIKNANGGTLVISGAPAPTGAEGAFGAERVWNDDRYIRGMASAGAANYADCIGLHYNEGIISPDQTSGDPRSEYFTRYFWGMVNTYYGAFGGARKLCFTELGYLSPEGYGPLSSGFAWAQNVTVAQQADWLARAASLSANSGKVRLMIIWNVDFTNYGEDPMAGYAIIRPGGSCPACEALGQVMGSR